MVWTEDLLGDICFTTSGGTPSRKNPEYYENATIPWVKSGELEDNIIFHTEEYITQAGLDNSSAKIFPAGTLLIALYGATIGKLSFLGIDAATNQAVCGLFKNEKVSLKYLYYYLLYQRPNLIKLGVGGAQPNISQTILKKLSIPYPLAFADQELIVTRIEELFSQLDSGVETLKKIKQQLTVYRQAVLKEAFDKYHDFVPLGQVSERIFDGPFGSHLKTADYTNDGIRVVRLENIKSGWFDDSKQSYVSPDKYETICAHTVFPSDLIMSTFISESIKICQLPQSIKLAVNKADCVGIRLQEDIFPSFIMLYLLSRQAYVSLIHQVHGATRPRVNTKQIKAILVPFANGDMQKETVAEVERKLSIYYSIEQTVDTALQQAEVMRQSILKNAFEGRL